MGFVFHRCWGIELRSLRLQSKHVNMLLAEIQSQLNSYGLDRSVVYMFVCYCLNTAYPSTTFHSCLTFLISYYLPDPNMDLSAFSVLVT